MTTCARIATTSAEVVVFCFSGGYDRIRKMEQKETVGVGKCFSDTKEGSERFMRKLFWGLVSVCLLAAIALAGCADKNEGEKQTGDMPVLVAEDFAPGNSSIFKTDKGYYYYSYSLGGFRYVDGTTGKEMFLCNKPECRHDGSEFCTATNHKYTIERLGLYGGRIVATAIEETDTQYLYHLISIALDGSELNEEVTYLTLEKTGVVPSILLASGRTMYVHRNTAFVPMWLVGDDDTEYHGTAVINLETKEVTYPDEESFSKNNIERTHITAYGDYFYYCQKEGKKTVLHLYNLTDGTDETHQLLTSFTGIYVVQDENTIVYTRGGNNMLCVYHRETGESEEKVMLKKPETVYYLDGTSEVVEKEYKAVGLLTDGEYIYVRAQCSQRVKQDENFNVLEAWEDAYVQVFDRELNPVTVFNMADALAFAKEVRTEHPEDYYSYYSSQLYFVGDEVYSVLPDVNTYKEEYVYRCTKESFLTGNPQYEFVYKMAKW